MEYIAIIITCFLASYVHSATGFGNALIIMSVLPMFLPIKLAALISVVCGCFISFETLFLLRKHFDIKEVLFQFTVYFLSTTIGVLLITDISLKYFSKLLGGLLLLLVFLPFIQKNVVKNTFWDFFYCIFGGLLGGMFAMGGPIMIHYFMNTTDKKEKFKTNLDFIFGVSGLYNIILHLIYGNINKYNIGYIGIALLAAVVASYFGYLSFKKINFVLIRKSVYIGMFIMGIKMVIQ
ncbi:sulfite exporter TauE/SafE family protein [Petroclostridium sp. X23]|uniref:sulfite exporter TauE/SafE family protein n=1 Tax=Petroclostridium sp. X23 TaxID=3045146 RepID=UPI0024AC8FF1|nr:sulfite exporter TauE/SafE family protein [Petroclostridium sp. X23]WHH60935.1 sulfite exporter TauE/SafE family protein [Petroclostridium sp. X23]